MKIYVILISLCVAGKPQIVTKNKSRDFGWKLLFKSGRLDQNKVISPLSIMGAMYMLAAGSAGDTMDEIYSVLTDNRISNFDDAIDAYGKLKNFLVDNRNTYTLSIANGIFANDGVLTAEYKDTILNKLNVSDIQGVDFRRNAKQATELINRWAAKNTNGLIRPMFPEPLDSDTALLLASSLYFKGSWTKIFKLVNEDSTAHERNAACWPVEFSRTDVCDESVEFISATGNFPTARLTEEIDGNFVAADVVEISMATERNVIEFDKQPYVNRMTYHIWLPTEIDISEPENDKNFQRLIARNANALRDSGSFVSPTPKTRVVMPKFSIDFEQDLTKLLQEFGINTVFSDNKDLTPMVGKLKNDQLEVSKINHKVKFDLDEAGIEGAATTSISLSWRTVSIPKPFVVTRPFYFTVTSRCYNENSTRSHKKGCPFGNVPIFIGKIVNPGISK